MPRIFTMSERLDKDGWEQFLNTVEADLATIVSNIGGGPSPPFDDIITLLTRIAVAVESIDAKTKGPKK